MSKKVNQTLGELIKETLKEKGLNQSAIAKKMNVTKQVINQIDRRKNFDIDFLQKLKTATGLDFTTYLYPANSKSEAQILDEPEGQLEMVLSVKVKSDASSISRLGELMVTIRREAVKMGFEII